MSIEEIAKKCHTRIAANNGFFDEKYFVGCIVDAIKEAIASQQSAHLTAFGVGTQSSFPLLGGTQADESPATNGGG